MKEFLDLKNDSNSNRTLKIKINEKEERTIKIGYIKMASKGDLILGTPQGWFCVVNMRYEDFKEVDYSVKAEIVAEPIKANPNKFFLVKALRAEIQKWEYVTEKIPVQQITAKVAGTTVNYGKFETRNISRLVREHYDFVNKTTSREILENRVDDTYVGFSCTTSDGSNFLFDPVAGYLVNYQAVTRFPSIPKKVLLNLSKIFTIAYPEKVNDGLVFYRIFYDGKEFEFVSQRKVSSLEFRITARRFAVSKRDRNAFEVHKVNLEPAEFIRILHRLKDFDVNSVKVKEISEFERFLEIFYVRTPKRKFDSAKLYFDILEFIQKNIERDATLYLVFRGEKKFETINSNFECIKFDGERYTALAIKPIAVSAIAVRGKFEEEYKKAYGIDELLRYQFADTETKLQILRKHIDECRSIYISMGRKLEEIKPDDLHLLEDIASKLPENNLIRILAENMKREKTTEFLGDKYSLIYPKIVLGLIKSGKPYDYTEDRLGKLLELVRIAVKYEIKSRGYSSRLGVIFSGTPETILEKLISMTTKMPRFASLIAGFIELKKEEIGKIPEISTDRVELLELD